MLIHPIIERLRGLGLAAMADAFIEMSRQSAADDLSREDWLGLLVGFENEPEGAGCRCLTSTYPTPANPTMRCGAPADDAVTSGPL